MTQKKAVTPISGVQARTSIVRSQCKRNAIAVFLVGLLLCASSLHAINSLPQLWPTFTQPSTIVNVGLSGQDGGDFMATVTFQGAYNQNELSSRLYLNTPSDASYWLSNGVPAGITVTNFPYDSGDPHSVLKNLLETYGPHGSNTVTKYVVCDPVNMPESCNMATTMAGINDAMVVNPDNLSVIGSYGLTQVADLRTYTWVGSNASLVNNTTINTINNPSGGSGTTGWSANGGTLTTATYNGATALKWTRAAGATGDAWAKFLPAVPAARINQTPYIFSVQVAGTGTAYLNAFNGCGDVAGQAVTLTSSYQTLQLAVPLPLQGCVSPNNTVQLQVRAHSQSNALTVYFINAAVISNRVAIDTYQYNNLIAQTSGTILAQHSSAGNHNLRDYEVAAKMFTFQLTSDNADEQALYASIIGHTPHNTPIMGYIDSENNDVTFLSGSGKGHFLVPSDNYNNGSVWASMPQPSSLSQTRPSPISPVNGTVYVAMAVSDGDNVSYIEHQNVGRWMNNLYFGAVPMAWPFPPGMINFAPTLISNFYDLLPVSQEIAAGPSGVGYMRAITGSDVTPFANYTKQFMQALGMNSLSSFQNTSSDAAILATALNGGTYNVPHVFWNSSLAYSEQGSTQPYTVLDGQAIWYNTNAATQLAAIKSWVASNYAGAGAPTYLEALSSNFVITPDDALYIAQQLQLTGGHPYVFMTPTEMASTRYAKSHNLATVPSSPHAVAGSTLTKAYPQNLLFNANGQSGNYSVSSTSWALGSTGHGETLVNSIYNGSGCMMLKAPGNASNPNIYAYEMLGKVPYTGRYYRFTATVAGTGTAFMVIYDGSANNISQDITLTSSWQTITMMIDINDLTRGQIQIGLRPSASAQTLYFNGGTAQPIGWAYNWPSASGGIVSAGGTTYNNGYFSQQAMYYTVPASQSGPEWLAQFPADGGAVVANTNYTATVDVAGTAGAQAYLDLWNGSTDSTSPTATLGQQWQTLTATFTTGASVNPAQFEIRVPAGNSATQTVYFRNAQLVPTSSIGTIDFSTGLETGQPQLSWTNTVDSTSPGGGSSGVSGGLTQFSSTITRGGGNAIQYGGTASGGSAHAYLEAFNLNNSVTLTSTSRLSYWIFPMGPTGSESGASSMTGLNSTCVAVDIIFNDATSLRDSGVTDQSGTRLHPAYQCNHLLPDKWNYVTVDLGSLAGRVVNRIDIGYDQAGAGGNYGGYVDDLKLSR